MLRKMLNLAEQTHPDNYNQTDKAGVRDMAKRVDWYYYRGG